MDTSFQDRLRGFRQVLASAGVSVPPAWDVRTKATRIEDGIEAADGLLRVARRPAAVFAMTDRMAMGLNPAPAGGRRSDPRRDRRPGVRRYPLCVVLPGPADDGQDSGVAGGRSGSRVPLRPDGWQGLAEAPAAALGARDGRTGLLPVTRRLAESGKGEDRVGVPGGGQSRGGDVMRRTVSWSLFVACALTLALQSAAMGWS